MADQELLYYYFLPEERTVEMPRPRINSLQPSSHSDRAGGWLQDEKALPGTVDNFARGFARLTLLARGPSAGSSPLTDAFLRLSMDLWLNVLDEVC